MIRRLLSVFRVRCRNCCQRNTENIDTATARALDASLWSETCAVYGAYFTEHGQAYLCLDCHTTMLFPASGQEIHL